MLAVTQINYIRHEINQKGETYAEVARRMVIVPRTVSKHASQEEFKKKDKQKNMNPVKPITEKYIKEDLKKKKKNQRTANRLYD